MITDDQAVAALRQANPALDERQLPEHTWTAPVLLQNTARRMTMQTNDAKPEPSQPKYSRWLLGAAAAVAIVLVVLGVGALLPNDGEPTDPTTAAATTAAPTTAAPTTAAPATTGAPATTVAPPPAAGLSETEAREVVDAAFAAFNAGDMETWVLWREGGATIDPDDPSSEEYALAVAARYEVEQCSYRGLEEWMMDERMLGHGFDCAVTYTDNLLEAAGIELEATYNWVIGADPESSLGGSNEDWDAESEFLVEYRDWLAATHPEVAATMQYDPEDDERPVPGSVPTALEYIDEFVAESDGYPLTEPVPEASFFGGPLR